MKTQMNKAQKMRAKDAKIHKRHNIFIWQLQRVSALNRDLLSLTVKMYSGGNYAKRV